jgi:hypothetical protein
VTPRAVGHDDRPRVRTRAMFGVSSRSTGSAANTGEASAAGPRANPNSGRHGEARIRLAGWVVPCHRGGGSSPGGWRFASEAEVAPGRPPRRGGLAP